MKPTVGRIVYYKSYGSPNGEFKPEERAAIVTAVHSDTELSLCILNPTGLFFNQNVQQGDKGGQWDWMPYQKAQAQMTVTLPNIPEEIVKAIGQQGLVNSYVDKAKGEQ